MALRVAVTGEPRVGKSTLLERAVLASGLKAGGMLARDRRIKGRRVGFEILDLGSGAVGILADESGDGAVLGKYRVHTRDLDQIGAKAIEEALKSELIVVDEIGPMELTSRRFVAAVERAIASDKPMLVVLHLWSQHILARKIRKTFRVVTVTRENRDAMTVTISEDFRMSKV